MATSVMSTNNSNINSNNNNAIVNYQSTASFNMPPLNNFPIQTSYLEQGGGIDLNHPTRNSNQSNQFSFTKSLIDMYGRNQAIPKSSSNHPSYSYDDINPLLSSNDVILQQQHVHNNVTNLLDNQFFSPEHVDGMVSILKGEEDFINLLDATNNTETLTSFGVEDNHHSFNPSIVASTIPKKRRSISSAVKSEEAVKSPSSSGSSSTGNNQATGSDNATTRTNSPTNSQEKNLSSSYPNGRKRASKACVECQKRHTRCGFERPCVRCVRLGLNCVEMKSTKKRGRSTMSTSNHDDASTNLAPTEECKNSQSGKKTKATPMPQQSSSETKKRKSSPTNNPTTPSSDQTTDINKPKIPLPSKSSDINADSTNSKQIYYSTTLTSSTSTNVTQPNNNIIGGTSSPSSKSYISVNQMDNQLLEKPLGVIAVGPDFTSVQYVSDPLSSVLATQPLTRLDFIMGTDFIQTQLNLLCEAKATRETIISHVENGLLVLQQAHLRAERSARAMIKLKDGKLAEMGIKFVFMYSPANPSILDSAYIFLNWNGSYYGNNLHY